MRNLSLPQKREAALALAEPVSADLGQVEMLQAKVDYLRSVLRSLLIRSPVERKKDVQTAIKELDRISSVIQLQATVDAIYNANYFRNEPDVEFKVALANALSTYMTLRIPSYNNPMLRNIAERSLDVSGLLRNFIEE